MQVCKSVLSGVVRRGIAPMAMATCLAVLFTATVACGEDREATAGAGAELPVAALPAGGNVVAAKPGQSAIPIAPSRGDEHPVYSLVDNRLSAHVQRGGGLFVPAGSAGFVKYLRFRKSKLGWDIRSERDGHKVAVMDGKTGRIQIPLTAVQAGASALRMRVHSSEARALSVRINGAQKQEITQQMAAGWSTVALDVPKGLLQPGENEILLFTGKGEPMALEWLQVGGGEPGEAAIYDSAKKALVLPRDGGLSYYVMVPEKGLVTGDLDDAACKVAVTATADSGAAVTGELFGKNAAVALGELAGQPVRLDLTAKGCDVARLAGASLVVPGKPAAVKRGEPPKYVVLWVMDSLRADRVKPFSPEARPATPTFERLSKEGNAFVQTYVQGNESRVSHASLWSSLYPVKHNMLSPKAKLDARWKTVDEVMHAAGMFTSGVSANGYVALKWGFGEAWDKYRNHIHEGGGLTGEDVMGKAIESVQSKKDPWFLYIGTIDTHVSWRPKSPWIAQYHAGAYSGRFAKRFSGEDAGKGDRLNMTGSEKEWVRALYDSNVSYQDDLLGQLLQKLAEWGIADQTMIIVTADHGDEQWEAGRVGHGGSLLETLVHVPLVIYYPPMFPGGVIPEGAEVVDVVPTIADVMGQPMDEEWQGESLLPLAHGVGAGYPRMSMASQYEGAHVGRIGSWKLRAPGSGKAELYNVADSADETADLVDKKPIARRFVADPLWLLRAYNMEWKKWRWGNAANVKPEFAGSFGE